MGIPFRTAKIIVEGNGDFRGTLGVSREVAVGVTDICLRFEVDSTTSDEQLATLMTQTKRYCVIFQTLRYPPQMAASLERVSARLVLICGWPPAA